MYGNFVLLDEELGGNALVERLALGDTSGRDEAWLRDTLFQYPDILPIQEIDPAYGPLVPLCTEFRTSAGRVDAVFINRDGRLTLVECKLWRNPEARRKVVAQVLDYARALVRMSYSDLQRELRSAASSDANLPFSAIRDAGLDEARFVDQVTKSLQQGRFLLVIAGDGIREDIEAITDLVNRNSTSAFTFALVEVGLYGLPNNQLLVQPRLASKTQLIERTVTLINDSQGSYLEDSVEQSQAEPNVRNIANTEASPQHEAYRVWWSPVLAMSPHDPDQDAGSLCWPNNVRFRLPMPGIWLTAYRVTSSNPRYGVFLSGTKAVAQNLLATLWQDKEGLLKVLPEGTQFLCSPDTGQYDLYVYRITKDFVDDDEARAWIIQMVHRFLDTLRPKLLEASQR